ncbi:ribonuclease P protein component [Celeribacter arenosi]|uniref:Ribonuclease P protein component n=1 Tax=Celeribacter arenosi TaxID=792649 RepID=A0ABP7K528_9RHOB
MTPPDAPEVMANAAAEDPRSAVLSCLPSGLTVLSKRADFLKAARARRQSTPSFLLQARKRIDGEAATGIRVGYTCSKKVGNAVARNHAKRRLREAARLILPEAGHDGWDYVLIGKRGDTSTRKFDLLLGDLKQALARIHGARS